MTLTPLQRLVRAEREQRAAARRQAPGVAALRALAMSLLALVAGTLCWRVSAGAADWVAAVTVGQAGGALAAAMLLAGVVVDRARCALRATHATSWLASLPVDDSALARHQRAIVARYVLLALAVVAVALTMLLWRAGVPGADRLRVLAGALSALTLAATIGWRIGARRSSVRALRRPQRIAAAVGGVGLAALARWPTGRLRQRCDGRQMARLLAPVLVLLPGGIGGGPSLAIIAVWLVLLLSVELWLALRDTVPRAARWLGATPLSARTFAWLMLQRPFGVWLCLGVLFVVAAVVIGMPWRGAAVGAVLIVGAGTYGGSVLLMMQRSGGGSGIVMVPLAQACALAVAVAVGVVPALVLLLALAVVNLRKAVAVAVPRTGGARTSNDAADARTDNAAGVGRRDNDAGVARTNDDAAEAQTDNDERGARRE